MNVSALLLAVVLMLGTAMPLSAQPPTVPTPPEVQGADPDMLMEGFGIVGCLTGATVAGALYYPMLVNFSLIGALNVYVGCSLGQLTAPLGLFANDLVTGDDSFGRMLDNFWKQIEEEIRKEQERQARMRGEAPPAPPTVDASASAE